MSVLLVSRGTMSGGQAIASCLAERMGIRYVSREELFAAVNAHGGIANRVLERLPQAARDYARFSELRRPYTILMRKALLDFAREGRLAYFGYSGHLLLEGVPHSLRVRLLAPLELRIPMTIKRLGITEEEAREFIRKADEERVSWGRFMYGKDIRDPAQYDLCINMEKAGISAVCDILAYVLNHELFRTTEASQSVFENICLATAVMAELVMQQDTFTLEIGATAREGNVLLEGPYLEPAVLERVTAITRGVPGCVDVEYKPGYAPVLTFSS